MVKAILIFMFIAALGYILAPLFQGRMQWFQEADPIEKRRNALDREKRIYLKALKDIEFEHASNKMSVADYQGLRAHYQQKASEVMAEIDEFDRENEKYAIET
jgi:hypothetical protein